MRRALLPLAALLLAAVPLGVSNSAAAAVPTCQGQAATQWLDAPGILYGTPRDDVLVGSGGNDWLLTAGSPNSFANSLIFDVGEHSGLTVPDGYFGDGGGRDLLCGNGGDDTLLVGGAGYAYGGGGNDLVGADAGALATGDAGDDLVLAADGARADGGGGDDQVQGAGAVALLGGAGDDAVRNLRGNPAIDCGPGGDRVAANGATDVRGCEGVLKR